MLTFYQNVAAAFEGHLKILCSCISYSYDINEDYSPASEWAIKCIKTLINSDVPKDKVYNINVPAIPGEEIKGLKPEAAPLITLKNMNND